MTITILTIIFYLFASSLPLVSTYWNKTNIFKILWIFSGGIALFLHSFLLHHWIDLDNGVQNLSFINMLSFSFWLIGILILAIVLWQPLDLLITILFPLEVLTILLIHFFPQTYVVNTVNTPQLIFHIFISIFTLCILDVAGFLAILLAVQERCIRFHRVTAVIEKLPSLQSMERLLFQILTIGFLFLTIVLITSFYFYHIILFKNWVVLQKTVLVFIAWCVLFILLIGRQLWGWRGKKTLYYTLTGVFLLLAAYCFSKFIIEIF